MVSLIAREQSGSRHLRVRGHALVVAGRLFWCLKCGAFTEESLRDLNATCLGRPKNKSGEQRKRLLWAGQHPVGLQPLERAALLDRKAWKELLARVLFL